MFASSPARPFHPPIYTRNFSRSRSRSRSHSHCLIFCLVRLCGQYLKPKHSCNSLSSSALLKVCISLSYLSNIAILRLVLPFSYFRVFVWGADAGKRFSTTDEKDDESGDGFNPFFGNGLSNPLLAEMSASLAIRKKIQQV